MSQSGSSLKARAMALLARRDYCRRQLQERLAGGCSSEELAELPGLLDWLEQRDYLSGERYAQGRVRTRASRYGNGRLARELAESGVEREVIAQALLDAEPESVRAAAVRRQRFGEALPADWKEKARQARFLAYRGFSMDTIHQVLREDFTESL